MRRSLNAMIVILFFASFAQAKVGDRILSCVIGEAGARKSLSITQVNEGSLARAILTRGASKTELTTSSPFAATWNWDHLKSRDVVITFKDRKGFERAHLLFMRDPQPPVGASGEFCAGVVERLKSFAGANDSFIRGTQLEYFELMRLVLDGRIESATCQVEGMRGADALSANVDELVKDARACNRQILALDALARLKRALPEARYQHILVEAEQALK